MARAPPIPTRPLHLYPPPGDRLALDCAFLALPAASLQLVWLADYSPAGGAARRAPRGRLPAEERFAVLYDSKLHEGAAGRVQLAQLAVLTDKPANHSLQRRTRLLLERAGPAQSAR